MAKKETEKKSNYGAQSIQVLEGLEPVRKRPGMYIGGTSLEGLHHLVWEVVNNSIDEAMAGFCTEVRIKLLPREIVEVTDNGRGIPVEIHPQTKKSTLETVLTILHAGGKFGGDGYKISGGLHGVGVSVVNALSVWTKAEVRLGGKIWTQEYKRGKPLYAVKAVGKATDTGTTITFQPDPEIFPEIKFSWTKILDYIRQQAYLTKGVKILIDDLREVASKDEEYKTRKYGFFFDGGIVSFVRFLNRGKSVKNELPVYIEKTIGDTYVEISLQYTDGFKEHLFSFANNIFTVEGGMHVTGFNAALTRVLNDYSKKNNLLKEKDGSLTAEDVHEGLTAVISVKLRNPQFEGQTKSKLGNGEIRGIVSSVTAEGLQEFLEKHPNNAKAMIEKCMLTARARLAARAAKDAVLRKGALEGMTLPGKLADCTTRDKEKSELYIVEGDSAGGCFFGDTKVALTDGRNVRFKDLVDEDRQGKKNYCYTIKGEGNIGIGEIKNPRLTVKNAEVLKVVLDNDEEIICTPNHKFMLRNGDYKEAKDLVATDSLMPLYRKISQLGNRITIKGYEMIFQPNGNKWIFTHLFGDRYNLEKGIYLKENGNTVHHKDFNKLNNNPDNLVRMPKREHLDYHTKLLEKTLHRPDVKIKSAQAKQTESFREKARIKSLEKRELFSENAKEQWKSPEYKEFMKNKFLDFYDSNEEYREKNNKLLNNSQKEYWSKEGNKEKQSLKIKEYFENNSKQREFLSEISKKQWSDRDLLAWRSQKTKEQWTDEFRERRKQSYDQTYLRKGLKLMKEIYEKYNEIRADIYDKKRKELNDKSLIKISTICERFFNGDRKKMEEAAVNFNHKIKRIEKMSEKMDVFDLEVPGTHNFALASGVFVHNSAKQGRDRMFQAILPLRGKLVNVEKTSLDKVVKSDTLKPIIIALGAGIGETFDISRLRYGKIIIMADADVDGSHIRTLLLTFFYRYFEKLVTDGHVYIACPPLYQLKKGKEVRYAYTDEQRDKFIEEMKETQKSIKSKSPKVEKSKAIEGNEDEDRIVETDSDSNDGSEKIAGINIQRYKGLGEMNPQQLWETTMDPATRLMLQVKIENAEEADRIFDILMGSDVEPRKRFIQTHAKNVKNLDV